MKLVTMISRFEECKGYIYTTEYNSCDIDELPKWENVDDSWADELITDEPESVDYKVWYKVVDDNGEVVDFSGKFWVRGE